MYQEKTFMKRRFITIVLMVAMMSIFASNVLAAPAGEKKVVFVRVTYENTGIAIIFKTSGITQDDLDNAEFFVGSDKKGMTCNLLDDGTTVRCTVDKGWASQGGFHVVIAGQIFWGDLPGARDCSGDEITWYSVIGYDNGVAFGSGNVPAWYWDWYDAQGYFKENALDGITYEITADFCAPNVSLPPL